MAVRWLQAYEQNFQPFRPQEAWLLYQLAAFGEAIGWGLLLIGIALKRYLLHGNDIPVLIAGQMHGTLFLIYIVSCLVLYPSLGWRRTGAVIAGLASIPPFGSLLVEQYVSHQRQRQRTRLQQSLILYSHFATMRA